MTEDKATEQKPVVVKYYFYGCLISILVAGALIFLRICIPPRQLDVKPSREATYWRISLSDFKFLYILHLISFFAFCANDVYQESQKKESDQQDNYRYDKEELTTKNAAGRITDLQKATFRSSDGRLNLKDQIQSYPNMSTRSSSSSANLGNVRSIHTNKANGSAGLDWQGTTVGEPTKNILNLVKGRLLGIKVRFREEEGLTRTEPITKQFGRSKHCSGSTSNHKDSQTCNPTKPEDKPGPSTPLSSHTCNSILSVTQLNVLQSIYETTPIPNYFLKQEIAEVTKMAVRSVESWFQSRRDIDINFQTFLKLKREQLGIGGTMKTLFRYSINLPSIKTTSQVVEKDQFGPTRSESLSQHQLDILQASYATKGGQLDTNVLSALTTLTGLSGRMIWIWFHNQANQDSGASNKILEKNNHGLKWLSSSFRTMENFQTLDEG